MKYDIDLRDFRNTEAEQYDIVRAYSVYLPTSKGKQEISIGIIEEDNHFEVYCDAAGGYLDCSKLDDYLTKNHYYNWMVYRDSVEECLEDVQILVNAFVLMDQEETDQFLREDQR